jgi:hypothetical protein
MRCLKWEEREESDYYRPIDTVFVRPIINLWLFGYIERVRVVEYRDQGNAPYIDLRFVHTRNLWLRDSFMEYKLGWFVHRILNRYNYYKEGVVSEYVSKYPFIRKFSKKLVREDKLSNILK